MGPTRRSNRSSLDIVSVIIDIRLMKRKRLPRSFVPLFLEVKGGRSVIYVIDMVLTLPT